MVATNLSQTYKKGKKRSEKAVNANKEVPYYWISAKEYSKQTGLGYEDALRMCKNGELTATQTDGGQWRIKIPRNYGGITQKEAEAMRQEIAELKIKLETVKKVLAG
jgi:excisionase family DNA binding protein